MLTLASMLCPGHSLLARLALLPQDLASAGDANPPHIPGRTEGSASRLTERRHVKVRMPG